MRTERSVTTNLGEERMRKRPIETIGRERRKSQQIESAGGEGKGERRRREDLESGERLEGWLKAYGITRNTAEIRGAGEHVERVRKARDQQEKSREESEVKEKLVEKPRTEKVKWKQFEFTFKRIRQEKF